MRRRTRTRYYETDTLQQMALASPHKFQAEAAARMLPLGWKVFKIKSEGNNQVILLSSTKFDCFGVLYPDGSFQRNLKGKKTVNWNWQRVRDAAQATVAA